MVLSLGRYFYLPAAFWTCVQVGNPRRFFYCNKSNTIPMNFKQQEGRATYPVPNYRDIGMVRKALLCSVASKLLDRVKFGLLFVSFFFNVEVVLKSKPIVYGRITEQCGIPFYSLAMSGLCSTNFVRRTIPIISCISVEHELKISEAKPRLLQMCF